MKARLLHLSPNGSEPQLPRLISVADNNQSIEDLSPSHPQFDRSMLTNDEFIERLIFENQELRSMVNKQDKWIDALTSQLNAHDIVPAVQKTMKGKIFLPKKTRVETVQPEHVPHDSPTPKSLEREEHPIKKKAQLEHILDPKGGVHLSPKLASAAAAAVMNITSDIAPTTPTRSLEEEQEVPERSARRKRESVRIEHPASRFQEMEEKERLEREEIENERATEAANAAEAAALVEREKFEKEQTEKEQIAREEAEREAIRQKELQALAEKETERARIEKEREFAEKEAERVRIEKEREFAEKEAERVRIEKEREFAEKIRIEKEEKAAIEAAEEEAERQRFERIEKELEKVRENKKERERLAQETRDLQAKLDLDIISAYEKEGPETEIFSNNAYPNDSNKSNEIAANHRDSVYSDDDLEPQVSVISDTDRHINSNNSIISNDKNQSSSSFNSYKSRLRLPPTLNQQLQLQQPHPLLQHSPKQTLPPLPKQNLQPPITQLPQNPSTPPTNQNQSHFTLSPQVPNSYSSTANYNSDRNIPVTPLTELKPAAIVASTIDYPQGNGSRITTPINQSSFESNINSNRKMPDTPEAFQNQTFGLKAIDNNVSTEDIEARSYIASPENNASYQQSQLSPTKSDFGSNDLLLKTPSSQPQFGYSVDSLGAQSARPPYPGSAQSNSSFSVLHTPKIDQVDLFIKPEEFQTISIYVLSTIYVNLQKRSDEPQITISVTDRASGKEMWRIRKTLNQMTAFDNDIRPVVEFFGLPQLPDRSLFQSTSPVKIDSRKNMIQNYFNTLFLMPHIPHLILYSICRFVSLDFVNPLDDFKSGARKEGYLIRRYKGLGSSWKIRWCQVDGPVLEIYEAPGGQLLEQIKLKGSQIGRQSADSVAEEKGYRHAFLLMESQKTSKLSSSLPKHFFCAENDEERDEWIDSLVEFNGSGDDLFTSNSSSDADLTMIMTPSANHSNGASYQLQNHQFLQQPHQQNVYSSGGDHEGRPYSSSTINSPVSLYHNGGSANTLFDQDSTKSIDESHKETHAAVATAAAAAAAKKMKKRSIFPFRSNKNASQENTAASIDAEMLSNSSSQPYLAVSTPTADTSMQQYLDQMNLDSDVSKSIFGRDIVEAYNLSNQNYFGRQIPSIILRCLDFLTKTGAVFEEGIFRLSGSASSIRQLKDLFNNNFDVDLFDCSLQPDIHTVAGLLKTYLRELPEPILGTHALNGLKGIVNSNNKTFAEDKAAMAVMFRDYMNKPNSIDQIHWDTCYVVFKFLKQIISNNSSNRMNLRNVCIVFVPTLNISLDILSSCLVDFECIFDKGQPVANSKREVLDLYIPNF